MFGYIQPVRDKLSQNEYETFRAVYCGLCHCMKRRCGLAARFMVNYDFTFMAMLLSGERESCYEQLRCIAHPFKARKCLCCSGTFDKAADMSVILGYLKLEDNIHDDGFFRSLASRLACICLRRGYKKACRREPEFAAGAEGLLSELRALEQEGYSSLDRMADKFAQILASAAIAADIPERRKVLKYLFYHIGRLVYILDAIDDLPEDCESGAYNAVARRFSLDGPSLDDSAAQALDLTVRHSINLAAGDYQLLMENEYSSILTNIIYFGIPAVASQMLQSRLPDTNILTGDKE